MLIVTRFEDLQRSLRATSSAYAVQPALTDQAITKARRPLNVTLPGSPLDLPRHRNGGRITAGRNAFPMSRPTSWSAGHVPFDNAMGVGRRE